MILLANFLIAFFFTALPLLVLFRDGKKKRTALLLIEAACATALELTAFALLQVPSIQQYFAITAIDAIVVVITGVLYFQSEPYYYSGLKTSHANEKGITKARLVVIIFTILLAVTIIVPGLTWGLQVTAANGSYLQGQVTNYPASALFANETLPINAVPLVTVSYAEQIAQSHMSKDFGGSAQVVDHEQIVYDGAPYWIFTIASTNTYSQNYEKGFILVNAVNGTYIEIQQKTLVGAGLCGICFSSIGIQTWLRNTNVGVGNWYPQPLDNGQVLYVDTLDQPNIWGATTFAGGIVYNPDGSVNATYRTIAQAPSYVNQPWDRELLVSLASQWAGARTNSGEAYCAWGCFLGSASSARLQLDSDGNYSYELIPYHNETAVMLFFSPANSARSLAGVMIASGIHINYYNLASLNYISPSYAQSQVHSTICTTTVCSLHAMQPILYPVNGQFVYITPVYYQDPSTGNLVFNGVAVTGASQSGSTVYVHGTDPVATRNDALSQYFNGEVTTTTTITTTVTGTVQAVSSYIQGGTSVVAIKLNGTWYTASPPVEPTTVTTGGNSTGLSFNDWYTIQNVQAGQQVTLTVRGTAIIAVKSA
ncbi:MAG: hypothetical protein JRN62_03780 [Nitrososphaerota archaeon]|nr:hypothetical protein [Nitrososphaerota archaeon]MDG6948722.1 hypothetical protein [Nitrososphaerota archaeon]